MYQMAPEDRLRNVMRYQEEQRKLAALERMARAAPAEKPVEAPVAWSAPSSHPHDPRLAVIQILRTLTGTHGVAPRHTAR